MKATYRILSVLLLAALLLPACSTGPQNTPTTTDTTAASVETTAPEETRPLTESERRELISDDLPDKKFDGKEFRIIGLTSTVPYYIIEEQNGAQLNDALYTRNDVVQSRFDIKIAMSDYDTRHTCRAAVQQSFNAGDADAYDLVCYHLADNGANALAGIYQNLIEVPHIDFDKPWWADSNREDLTINNKCFVALGDLTVNTTRMVWAHLFNKELAETMNVENLYDVVRRGDWTIDYIKALGEACYVDVNGNGQADVGDTWGMAAEMQSSMNTYLWAFDNPIIKKDADGVPQYLINTEKLPDIVTTIVGMFRGGATGIYASPTTQLMAYQQDFINGNVVVIAAMFSHLETRAGEADFSIGVLPYPKWDTDQKEYLTMLDGGCESIGITRLEVGDQLDFIGLITEALCAESYKKVSPVYYDILLKNRYADRPDDAEMIQLVMDGRVYDLGYIYDNWNGAGFWMQTFVQNNNTNIASYLKKAWPAVQKYYDKVLALFYEES